MKGINQLLDEAIKNEVAEHKLIKQAKAFVETRRPVTRRSIEDIIEQKRLRKEFDID